jgi:hypothetical protein
VADEGTKSNPIFLEGLSAAEFSSFLRWIYHVCMFVYLPLCQSTKYLYSDWQPLPQEESLLINILKVARLWMVESGIQYAIHHLEMFNLHPSRQLEIAIKYKIPEWVAPAIKALMDIPL